MVSNVNEHKPWFTKRVFEVDVNESVKVGTPVVTVTAKDEDESDNLVYMIQSGSSNSSYSLFSINHNTGMGSRSTSTLWPPVERKFTNFLLVVLRRSELCHTYFVCYNMHDTLSSP